MYVNVLAAVVHAASETAGAAGSHAAGGTGAGVLNMVLSAGVVVQAIMAGLVAMSVLCWGIVILKARLFQKARKESEKFSKLFLDQTSYDTLLDDSRAFGRSYLAHIFRVGYAEMKRVKETLGGGDGLPRFREEPEIVLENVNRAIQGAAVANRRRMKRFLPILATTGSTAPFVGLFGTVWGIMTSFQDIGARGSANLAVVAPGISEALIATAMGLAAAIPAVAAYNYFSNRIQLIDDEMVQFSIEFLNSLKRDLIRP